MKTKLTSPFQVSCDEPEPAVQKRPDAHPAKKRPKSLNLDVRPSRSHSIITENPEVAEEAINAESAEQTVRRPQRPQLLPRPSET